MVLHGLKFIYQREATTSVLILENNYQVDFRQPNSISSVLGFNNDIYTLDFQKSENVVNILSINSLLVNIYIVSGSYVNSSTQPTIYSFFPNVSPETNSQQEISQRCENYK